MRITLLTDKHHAAHRGAATSAESPDRVDEVRRWLLKALPDEVVDHQFCKPLELATWSGGSRNCSACTAEHGGEIRCPVCGTEQKHIWRYVGEVDGDTTYETPYTSQIVSRAKWLTRHAVDRVLEMGETVFGLFRPPGHHACDGRRAGFCHENFAVVALDAAAANGKRAAILDTDAHHGDGTEKEVLKRAYGWYASIHGFGENVYPGTGAAVESERVLNCPLSASAGEGEWLVALGRTLAWIAATGAEMLIVSCGFDGHQADAMAPLRLRTATFFDLGVAVRRLGLPTLFLLEGGYDLATLGASAESMVSGYLRGSG